MRACKKCAQPKELNSENFRFRVQRGSKYFSHTCLECIREYGRSFSSSWRAENPELRKASRRKSHLKEKFQISVDDYNKQLEHQNGLCAICDSPADQTPGRSLAVDHNHATREIRGVLCGNCNRALGLLNDSPELLRKAALYLESTNNRILRKAA